MQDSLFDTPDEPASGLSGAAVSLRTSPATAPPARAIDKAKKLQKVQSIVHDAAMHLLAGTLPPGLRLGASSWAYTGWEGIVWDGAYNESLLSRQGLTAYAQHPLFGAVCIDRSVYRPMSASQYATYAAQVPDDFRFVVKAPSLVTDAMVRGEDGRGQQANPAFLDPVLACREFLEPAIEGLGHKIGALVFQLSPLPGLLLGQIGRAHV